MQAVELAVDAWRRAAASTRCSTPPRWRSPLRRARAEHLAALRERLPAGLPLLYVPYLFARSHGLRAVTQVADALGEELG